MAPGARALLPAPLALLVFAALAGCGRPAADTGGPPTYAFRGEALGTSYDVKVVASAAAPEDGLDETRQAEVAAAITGVLEAVDAVMSTYRDDSELSRLNRHREVSPFAVSAETFAVLTEALAIGRRSDGAFDVTVGPLVNAWGFGPEGPTRVPGDAELAALRARTGLDVVVLDHAAQTVAKRRPEVYVDLSGIAKGHAVDRIGEALDALGLGRHLVEVGGEMRARGSNAEGRPWRVGIERPDAARRTAQRIVPLRDAALATSGDYRNYREVDGRRISHIIDPRTGRPIAHRLASVSVIAERCAQADAWATALLVLGPDQGPAFAEREGLAALFLIRDPAAAGFLERATSAFVQHLGRPAP